MKKAKILKKSKNQENKINIEKILIIFHKLAHWPKNAGLVVTFDRCQSRCFGDARIDAGEQSPVSSRYLVYLKMGFF